MSVDTLSIVVKAIGYITLLQGVGIALFVAAFGPLLERSGATIRHLGVASVVTSIVALLLFHLIESARMTGEYGGVMDPVLQGRVLSSSMGATTGLRLLGATLVVLGLWRESSARTLLAIMGATIATTSFLLVGHSVSHQPRWLLVPLLEFHVLVAAFWFGSIAPLIIIARREVHLIAHAIVKQFSSAAAALVPAMAAAGLGMAWMLTGGTYSITDPYCVSLTGKVGLLAIALMLAGLHRWRFGPSLATGSSQVVRMFSRSLAFEYVVLATVIALTATMTNLFSPGH